MLVLTARDRDRVDIELNGKKLTLEFFVERRRVRVGYQGPMEFRVTRHDSKKKESKNESSNAE